MSTFGTTGIPDAGSEVPRRAGSYAQTIRVFGIPQTRRLLLISILQLICFCSYSVAKTIIHVTPENIPQTTAILENLHDDTIVRFAAGTYFFAKPITLPDGVDLVMLEPESIGPVVLSAGQLIQGWKPDTLNGHPCFSTPLIAVQLGIWNFRELWVNGTRATRCRFPAHGYLASVEPKDDITPWNQGQTWFGYKPGDLPDDLPKEAEAIVMNRWEDSRLPIDSVDVQAHQVHSTRKSVFHLDDGDPYFLEGAAAWFQQPGDWYLDHSSGVLYYLPRPGETLEKLSAVAPTRDQILLANHIEHLTIDGLNFSHSEWNLPEQLVGDPPQVGGFGQAEVGVSAAVSLLHCSDSRIQNCHFLHLGNYALQLGQGCQHDVISRCTFTDLGSGGIKIGETDTRDDPANQTFGNTISDCRITDGGHLFPSACGIWLGQASDNQIIHNELSDLYYTGISIGWTWGYGPSLCKGNQIKDNLIHDIGKKSDGEGPILSDMGAVYTLGARSGTVISGNVFHDITARVYGGWGIYLDEGSSNETIENNLVYRTTHGAFHVNYGQNNLVQNNIFALSRDIQIARTRTEPGVSLTFKNNIVCWNTGIFTATDPDGLNFDVNLYHCFGNGKLLFGDRSFDQWKAAGRDRHSILADPGFVDPSRDNFSLPADSPANQIHFERVSFSDVGPRTR